MSKKKGRNIDDEIRVYRGVIPWSVAEHDWVVATFEERRPKGIDHLPFPEEFADLKDEMKCLKGEELQNIKDMILFSHIFRQRYPKKLEYDAHFYRFNQINKFLQIHHDELLKMDFVSEQDGEYHIVPQLIETLCMMMFDEEDFDEAGEFIGNTFSFKDVVAKLKAKINPQLNKKAGLQPKDPDKEDKGFRGMIPWSKDEFNWIMNQQLIRRQKLDENEELEEEYLPLKIQMMRQTTKYADNFNTMVLLNEIFHERYSNPVEAMAHFFRYHSIFKFLDQYRNELIKEGLVDGASGDAGIEPELIDSLCVLPYSLEQTESTGEKSYTYLYADVVQRAKLIRNARLN